MAKSAHGKAAGGQGKKHHEGFHEAMEDALANASKDLGPGTYDVEVHFTAEVTVTNPGVVGFYKVQLSKL
jgi:hypothetical protein